MLATKKPNRINYHDLYWQVCPNILSSFSTIYQMNNKQTKIAHAMAQIDTGYQNYLD